MGQVHRPRDSTTAMHYWDLPDDGQGPHRGPVREVPPGRGRGAEGRARSTPGLLARRALRLLRLPQDQGLGGPAQGGARPHQDHRQDRRGVDLPLDQGAEGRSGPRACRRSGTCALDETDEHEASATTSRPTRWSPTSSTEGRPRDLPGAARGRPRGRAARRSRPSAAWAATASATTSAAWTRFAAASFRTHGPNLDGTGSKVNAGWLYAWVKRPEGLLARDADAQPAAHATRRRRTSRPT